MPTISIGGRRDDLPMFRGYGCTWQPNDDVSWISAIIAKMPLTIRLQTENGQIVRELFDSKDILTRLVHDPSPGNSSERPLLRYIDPYGLTVFNGVQASDLRIELDLLRPGMPDEVSLISEIKNIAQTCAAGVHLFLWFIGD